MDKQLGRIMLKVLGFDLIFLMEDSLYVMRREEHLREHADRVQDFKDRFRNSMIAGGAFGLALIFSLRRYFPGQFSGLTANRILIETTVVGGSLFCSSISVLLGASKLVHAVKKDHILGADPQVYTYLHNFKEKYQVDEETQVRYLLSTEEFQEWKKYRT